MLLENRLKKEKRLEKEKERRKKEKKEKKKLEKIRKAKEKDDVSPTLAASRAKVGSALRGRKRKSSRFVHKVVSKSNKESEKTKKIEYNTLAINKKSGSGSVWIVSQVARSANARRWSNLRYTDGVKKPVKTYKKERNE